MATQKEVVLGFLEKPYNSVIVKPQYTPSKVGGQPAYIWPHDTPAPVCADCGFQLSFLMQIYANINDSKMDDYHRMIYIFLCVSEKCIGTQRAVRVFRCIVPHKNDAITFDNDGTYFDIQHKTDNQLISLGYKINKKQEAKQEEQSEKKHDVFKSIGQKFGDGANKEAAGDEENQIDSKTKKSDSKQGGDDDGWADCDPEDFDDQQPDDQPEDQPDEFFLKTQQIVFKEFIIDTDTELAAVSRVYFKQSKKLAIEKVGGKENWKKKMLIEIEQSQSESEDDPDGDLVDTLFTKANFGYGKDDEKRAQALLKQFEDSQNDQGDSKEKKSDQQVSDELDQFLEDENPDNQHLSKTYKLFNYVAKQNEEQVIRYLTPTSFKYRPGVYTQDPLWHCQENQYAFEDVPQCDKCGQPRQFEIQIMPQMFFYIEELNMVDWDTIAVYTCTNADCLPDFNQSKGRYMSEFAYVQLSTDFSQVKYGTDKEIKTQKKQKEKLMKELQDTLIEEANEAEENPDRINISDDEGKEEVKKGEEDESPEQKKKNKKKKKKQKQKEEDENTKQQVQDEVQEGLGDLLSSMNLGGK